MLTIEECANRKFDFGAIKCYNNNEAFIMNDNYKITKSSYRPVGTFACLKQSNTPVSIPKFCLQVADEDKIGLNLYELDIVRYKDQLHTEERSGVVIYSSKLYGYGVLDAETNKFLPLYSVQVTKVLGNMYSDPTLLVKPEEKAKESQPPVSAPIQAAPAATDVYAWCAMDKEHNLFWFYKLQKGERVKEQHGKFNATGADSLYYQIASAVIALEQLRQPKKVVFHSQVKALCNMINSGRIFDLDIDSWTFKDGRIPSDSVKKAMRDLQSVTLRLGKVISAEHLVV